MILRVIIILIIFIIIIVFVFFNKFIFPLHNNQPFSNLWSDNKKNKMKKLLLNSKKCLTELDVEFFPIYGSLLGLIRNGGLIPWDDDMDICIERNNFHKILDNKHKFEKYGIDVYIKNPVLFENNYLKLHYKDGNKIPGYDWSWPFIDVFGYTEDGDTVKIEDNSLKIENIIDKKDLFPFRTNTFEDIPFNIPNNVDNILNKLYGDNWEKMCYSSPYNHQKEHGYKKVYKTKCENIDKSIDDKIFDQVYVINLDRTPERWKLTLERLKKLGINNPKRWKAIDSKSQEMIKFYNKLPVPKITINELCCYLSHRQLWKYLYDNNIDNAIIFEDDIFIPNEVTKDMILDQIFESKAFNVLFLGYCDSETVNCCKPKSGNALCTHAYAVSKIGLDNLIKMKDNFSKPIDLLLNNFCREELCFLTYNIEDPDNFGSGFIKQDNNVQSVIPYKKYNII